MFGAFDFNETLMASSVTKIIAHEKQNKCATWSNNGISGWCIGPALEHYRCYKVFLTKTRSEIIADVEEFSPQNVKMPRVLSSDVVMLSAQHVVGSLQNTTPNSPFATINDTHHIALRSLVELFNIIPEFMEKNRPTDIMYGGGRWKSNHTKCAHQ